MNISVSSEAETGLKKEVKAGALPPDDETKVGGPVGQKQDKKFRFNPCRLV